MKKRFLMIGLSVVLGSTMMLAGCSNGGSGQGTTTGTAAAAKEKTAEASNDAAADDTKAAGSEAGSGAVTVSYTHLDVYKRQDRRCRVVYTPAQTGQYYKYKFIDGECKRDYKTRRYLLCGFETGGRFRAGRHPSGAHHTE